jgi:hypothetical protein
MNKKAISTYEEHLKGMTKNRRKKFDEEYHDLLLSELLIARAQKNNTSITELNKMMIYHQKRRSRTT